MTEPSRNRRTVAAYDDYAEKYAEVTRDRLPIGDEALAHFADALGPGARVLEVASGPGWDADELERRGLHVRRTDLSEGFIAVQRRRGKVVEPLDLVSDDLGGPWEGLMALYVLQHIERGGMEGVIRRIVAALRPGGLFLTSFQEGEGEWRQTGSEGGTYTMICWRPADMLDLMAGCGLEVDWSHSFEGDEARWTILIARRP
ncbi:class I SAM-dependent methyltransferase [Brevundimonas kwangchunensis]|uniref:Class I SAM-dependent methyltransferase n=1 Tax=Brevundimonas kwangchunensis TaxID=322163 RepID=A0ABN1GZK9_9CAUL